VAAHPGMDESVMRISLGMQHNPWPLHHTSTDPAVMSQRARHLSGQVCLTSDMMYRMSPTFVDAAKLTPSMLAVRWCAPRRREALM
jgi:hypothetical protein